MQVEFFHDVICSFCFPMSYRMRKVAAKYPKLNITHRSFALGWEAEEFIRMFGSHEAVKPEVLGHWEHANQNDDEHRFNIEGMKEKDFLFPTSKNGLKAAKAAGLLAGEAAYWNLFDALQHALFVDNRDIGDLAVIEAIVQETSIDLDKWKTQFDQDETEEAVLADLQRVRDYGIQGAPAIVVNQKYLISGAQPQAVIEQTIEKIAEEEGFQLTGLQTFGDSGDACRIVDGQWMCD
ncbi:thioredoxin domain-containing protein [Aerococcaceae bacterium WS4759]|uniref:Thioredoxin domain-containing protein n=1 Tax=Fundicoccus ignavus TaxID=2664442 RepID=A0A6I2H0X5_9LACT|nr:DsbA family protein [Fundicoccus ignavus]MRI86273.1 thioredoxin domain-containing protein [Fundicoccus ignavus]